MTGPTEHQLATSDLEPEIGARTARDFIARSLAWEHRLQSLRDAANDVAPIASTSQAA